MAGYVSGAKEPMKADSVIVDDQFASALDIKLKRGRFFSNYQAVIAWCND